LEFACFNTIGAGRVRAVLDTETPEAGFVCVTGTGAIDPRAEVAPTSRLAVANDTERIRFATFPVAGAMFFSFSIESSINGNQD
jgi:hypothetical protein